MQKKILEKIQNKKVVISLCDLSGNFVKPWVENNYFCVLIDFQHPNYKFSNNILTINKKVEDSLEEIKWLKNNTDIVFVSSFPPCQDLATSGARWFIKKYEEDFMFQAKAVKLAETCRMIGELSEAPYFVENPVSVLSSVWGKANNTFHPWHYTGFEPEDNYKKLTCLWTGNNFIMPEKFINKSLPEPDDRILKAPDSKGRKAFREKTPLGFSRAVFYKNRKEINEQSRSI